MHTNTHDAIKVSLTAQVLNFMYCLLLSIRYMTKEEKLWKQQNAKLPIVRELSTETLSETEVNSLLKRYLK